MKDHEITNAVSTIAKYDVDTSGIMDVSLKQSFGVTRRQYETRFGKSADLVLRRVKSVNYYSMFPGDPDGIATELESAANVLRSLSAEEVWNAIWSSPLADAAGIDRIYDYTTYSM